MKTLGIEGPVWSSARFLDTWNDPPLRENLLQFLSSIEREPSVTGASAHLIALAHRPG